MAWMGRHCPPFNGILFKRKTVHLFLDCVAVWQFHYVHLCHLDSIELCGIFIHRFGVS